MPIRCKKYWKYLPVFLLLFYKGFSQTSVKGKVVDVFGDPIYGAYIGFAASGIYTSSDTEGKFALKSSKSYDLLKISAPGYRELEVPLKESNVEGLVVSLKEINSLKEIVVKGRGKRIKKTENPAYPIMQKIWERSKVNGLDKENVYEYRKMTSLESGGRFSKELLKKLGMVKNDETILPSKESVDSLKSYETPLNLKELMEHYYVNNITDQRKTVVEFSQDARSFNSNAFLFERMEYTFNEVDIYKNSLRILDNTFESPLSKSGFTVYNYILTDSMVVDNHKYYKISFYPYNDQSLAFQGEFTVEAPSYAITDVRMTTLKGLNMNLVKNISIQEVFTIKSDSVYLPKKTILKIDYSVYRGNIDLDYYVKKVETYGNYVFNEPKPFDFYRSVDSDSAKEAIPSKALDSAALKERRDILNVIEKTQNNKKIQFGFDLINTFSTGYVPIGKHIQLGSLYSVYGYNQVEGARYSVGLRTFKNLNDRFRVYGYYAFSSRISRSNFGIYPSYLIGKGRTQIRLGGFYLDDLRESVTSLVNGSQDNLVSLATPFANLRSTGFVSDVRSFGFSSELAITPNFRLGAAISRVDVRSADISRFKVGYFNGTREVSDFLLAPLRFSLSYTPKRNVLGTGIEQAVGGARYMSLSAGFVHHIRSFGSDIAYNSVSVSFFKPFRFGRFGRLTTSVRAGKLFSVLPVQLLSPVSSSSSLFGSAFSFNNLNPYDFVMDTYVYFSLMHQFNGYILNKIPLINKLRFRSLVFFNLVYGDISPENIAANRSSVVYNAPKPYFEYGFGIENIGIATVRVLRINFIWRGDLQPDFVRNSTAINPRFGIRLNFVLSDF